MSTKSETPFDQLKQLPLWQWGLLMIVVGLLANILSPKLMAIVAPAPPGSNAARGQAFGAGLATLWPSARTVSQRSTTAGWATTRAPRR